MRGTRPGLGLKLKSRFTGRNRNIGATGCIGIIGIIGITGKIGMIGRTGIIGIIASTEIIGSTGLRGRNGSVPSTGNSGSVGVAGKIGITVCAGNIGIIVDGRKIGSTRLAGRSRGRYARPRGGRRAAGRSPIEEGKGAGAQEKRQRATGRMRTGLLAPKTQRVQRLSGGHALLPKSFAPTQGTRTRAKGGCSLDPGMEMT